MKHLIHKTTLVLILAASSIACGDGLQNIPLNGCYCDEIIGVFRSGPLMSSGESYRFSNHAAYPVSVIIMPGSVQSLGTVMPGQTVCFTSGGTSLLIFASGHAGEPVSGLRLELVLPTSPVNPKQPPVE